MKLIKLREGFWFNPEMVTSAWLYDGDIRYNLASDGPDEWHSVKEPLEIDVFCKATGIEL